MRKHYFKTAWRSICRNKFYAVTNIAGLSLGLGAFCIIMLYAADELGYDRFHKNAERIFRVAQHTRWNNNDLHQATTSAPFAPAMQLAFPEIEQAVRIDREGGGIITANNKKFKQEDIIVADKSITKIFTYDFLAGNPASALDEPGSVIINTTLAKKLFGSVENAFRQTIIFDEQFPAKITGVFKDIPANSHFQYSAVRAAGENHFTGNWQNFSFYTYLLLKKGTDPQKLEAKLPAFADATLKKQMRVNDYVIELQPLTSIHLHSNLAFEAGVNGNASRVYILIAIAILVLVIAIINYTNLTTARSSARVKEIGVRKVIGSGKKHIAGIFIAEAILIMGIAALISVGIIYLALPFLNELTGKQLTIEQLATGKILMIYVLFVALTGIISGLYPSVFVARFKVIPSLKGQLGNFAGTVLLRRSLVVFQFMITIIMISAAIVIYQQLDFTKNTDLGFNREQVLTFHIDNQRARTQVSALKESLMKSSSIEAVAAAGNPIGNNDLGGMGYRFEMADGSFSTNTTVAQELMVDADFLPTMQIQLLQGRNFSPLVTADKYGAAIINESLLKKTGWKDAIGKRIQFYIGDNLAPIERTIVGVIKDFHTYSLQHRVEPLVMVMPPAANSEDNIYVRIAKGKSSEGLAVISKTFREFDNSNQATFNFLDENFARQYAAEEKQGKLAFVFAALAIFIACLGLSGLATFTAAQRTREIGIRKVMGATIANIVRLLSADFLLLVAIAAVVALPIAWIGMQQWLQGFAYAIELHWWILACAALIAVLIAALTVGLQSLKAASANPVKSLKSE